MISHFQVCNGLRKITLKENIFDIMKKRYPEEYKIEDQKFFDEYKGKTVWVYNFNGAKYKDDWFVLEDNNYQLSVDCFEEE